MLTLVIVIRCKVDDETEAHNILAYFDDHGEADLDHEFFMTCKVSQEITND